MNDNTGMKAQKLFELGQRLAEDEALRLHIQRDPLSFLRENDIAVEDEFAESVTQSLIAITRQRGVAEAEKRAFSEAKASHDRMASAPMPPANLRVVVDNAPPDDEDDEFQFRVNEWGLVLVVPEPLLHKIVNGVLSSAEISKALMTLLDKLSSTLPSSGKAAPFVAAILGIAAIWVGIQTAWLLAETALILLVDSVHHKGVYLTWTWVGIGLTAYLPIPTPIT